MPKYSKWNQIEFLVLACKNARSFGCYADRCDLEKTLYDCQKTCGTCESYLGKDHLNAI